MQRGVNKKWFFACALVLLIVGVVAYGTTSPSTFGHSAGEVNITLPDGRSFSLQDAVTQGLLGGSGGPGGTTLSLTTGERFLVESVAMSRATTCLLLKGGDVACAGYGSQGDLGIGSSAPSQSNYFLLLPIHNVKQIFTGQYGFCVIYDPVPNSVTGINKAACWGTKGVGALGNGDTLTKYVPTPVNLSSNEQVIDIAMDQQEHWGSPSPYSFTCLLMSDRTVKCMGYNGLGQLGVGAGDTTNRYNPSLVVGVSNVQSLKIGGSTVNGHPDGYACVIVNQTTSPNSNQGIKCWGTNDYGQLGKGNNLNAHSAPLPEFVTGFDFTVERRVKEIALSQSLYATVCAILGGSQKGAVQCWGYNGYGQVGNNLLDDYYGSPRPHSLFDGSSADRKAVHIKFGGDSREFTYACGLAESGKLVCWGYNGYGQLGLGTNVNAQRMPEYMLNTFGSSPLQGVKDVAFGGQYQYGSTCVLMQEGTIKCTGDNDNGQLGIGEVGDRNRVSTVFGITSARAVFSGSDSSTTRYLAILADNSTRVWGANYYGSHGIGGDGFAVYVPTKPL